MKKSLVLVIILLIVASFGCSESKKSDPAQPNLITKANIPAGTVAISVGQSQKVSNTVFGEDVLGFVTPDFDGKPIFQSLLYGTSASGEVKEITFSTPYGDVRGQVVDIEPIEGKSDYMMLKVGSFMAVSATRDNAGYIAQNSGYDGRNLLMDKTGKIYDLSSIKCPEPFNMFHLASIPNWYIRDNFLYGFCLNSAGKDEQANRFKVNLANMSYTEINSSVNLNDRYITFDNGDLLSYDQSNPYPTVYPGSENRKGISYALGLEDNLSQYLTHDLENDYVYEALWGGSDFTSGTTYNGSFDHTIKNSKFLTVENIDDILRENIFPTGYFPDPYYVNSKSEIVTLAKQTVYEGGFVDTADFVTGSNYACYSTDGGFFGIDDTKCIKGNDYFILSKITIEDGKLKRTTIFKHLIADGRAAINEQVVGNTLQWAEFDASTLKTFAFTMDLTTGFAFGAEIAPVTLPADPAPIDTGTILPDGNRIYYTEEFDGSSITTRKFYSVFLLDNTLPAEPFFTVEYDDTVEVIMVNSITPLAGSLVVFDLNRTDAVSGDITEVIQIVDSAGNGTAGSVFSTEGGSSFQQVIVLK